MNEWKIICEKMCNNGDERSQEQAKSLFVFIYALHLTACRHLLHLSHRKQATNIQTQFFLHDSFYAATDGVFYAECM